jgi:hypothetical protein
MVAHEDIGVHVYAVFGHGLTQQIVEVISIEVVNEDCAAIDTTLGDVEGIPRKQEARATWHAASLASADRPWSRQIRVIAVGQRPAIKSLNSLRPLCTDFTPHQLPVHCETTGLPR